MDDQEKPPQRVSDLGWATSLVILGRLSVGLIGEQPSKRSLVEQSEPLAGRPTDFLGRLLGITGAELRSEVGRMNLMESDGRWLPSRAREKAAYLEEEVLPYLPWRTIVLLGRRVQRAFGLDDVPAAGLLPGDRWGYPRDVCWIPHPSGLNRWYNEPANRALVAATLGGVLHA